jgi:uncharacterized protein
MDPRPKAIMALWLLLAASIAVGCAGVIGCAGGRGARHHDALAPVEVTSVGFDRDSATHYVVLREHPGGRTLPILIGDDEARAIMFEMRGVKPDRPLTYELLRDVIEQTGNRVDRVVIADMRDEIYFARIYLDHGRYVLDSRPSDAIALAVGAKAPIFVADKLFQSVNQLAPGVAAPVKTAYAFGLTVQELTPELAQYFGVDPDSGVVVADLGPVVGKDLERGDIITNVEGHEIRNPGEFTASMKSLSGTPRSVSITVHRGDATRVVTLNLDEGAPAAATK